jgi:hypothetical protein
LDENKADPTNLADALKLIASLEAQNRQKDAVIAQKDAEIEETGMLTGEKFCSQLLFKPGFSDSPACLHTNEKEASVVESKTFDRLEMPRKFWLTRAFPRLQCHGITNESEAQDLMTQVAKGVINALTASGVLRADELIVVPQFNLLDAIPDLMILWGRNRYPIGTVEVKKHCTADLPNSCLFRSLFPGKGLRVMHMV